MSQTSAVVAVTTILFTAIKRSGPEPLRKGFYGAERVAENASTHGIL